MARVDASLPHHNETAAATESQVEALSAGGRRLKDATSDLAHDTRRRVARSMLEDGASTAAEISDRLGLTSAAVRRHLDALGAAGHISSRERVSRGPRGRGRPAKEYLLTESGRDEFEQAYDDLAAEALRYLRETAGVEAVRDFARRRLRGLVDGLAAADAGSDDTVATLARLLTEQGYATSVEASPFGGEQICQHHCPVAHVAAEFPELCEVETEVFRSLLGSPVQRLATIAHGDGVCTTHVSARDPASAPVSGGAADRDPGSSKPKATPPSERTPS